MPMTIEEAYSILEVSSSSSETEVKKAYKRLALQTHPDKNPNDPDAHKKFLAVSEAYKRVTDPDSFKDEDEGGMDMTEEDVNNMFMEMFGSMMGGRGNHFRSPLEMFMFMDMMAGDFEVDEDDDDYDSNEEYYDDMGFESMGGFDFMAQTFGSNVIFIDGDEMDFEEAMLHDMLGMGSTNHSRGKKSHAKTKKGGSKKSNQMNRDIDDFLAFLEDPLKARAPLRQDKKSKSAKKSNKSTKRSPLRSTSDKSTKSSSYRDSEESAEPAKEIPIEEDMLVEDEGWETESSGDSRKKMKYPSNDPIASFLEDYLEASAPKKKKNKHKKPMNTETKATSNGSASNHSSSSSSKQEYEEKESNQRLLKVGDHVLVQNRYAGTVGFVGEVHYAKGIFVGIVTDDPAHGKNDGTLKGIKYFDCPGGSRGLMVTESEAKKI